MTEALSLGRSTLRTRRWRGRLARRGTKTLPSATGPRLHALIDTRQLELDTPRYIVRCGTGLIRIRDARGRVRTATLQERAAFDAANEGRCMCSQCVALRAPLTAEELAQDAAEERARGLVPDDSDEVERPRERVL